MEDQTQLVKSDLQSEWTNKEKESVLFNQKVVSSLGIFITIVQCTNLFQINSISTNPLTKGFAFVTLFLVILNLATLAWTFYMNKTIKSGAATTDTWPTRFILYLNIILLISFLTYFILFTFAKQDLYNSISQNFQDVQEFDSARSQIAEKSKLINFFSVANIFVCVFAIFSSYALNGTPLGCRFQVYIFGVFLALTNFLILRQIHIVQNLYEKASTRYDQWPICLTWAVALASLILTLFLFIANAKRLRIAYLTLGTFLLICCIIQLPATGALFRNYNKLQDYYKDNCVNEMGSLHYEFLEGKGCKNKYNYQPQKQCPNSNPEQCFQYFFTCDKSQVQTVWETKLLKAEGVSDPNQKSVLACMNLECCGLVNYIYTHPVLALAALSFCQLALAFVLTCFSYQLSTQEKGNEKLNQSIQLAFFGIFLLILIIGSFTTIFAGHASLNKRPVIEAQNIPLIPNKALDHYPNSEQCDLLTKQLKQIEKTKETEISLKLFDPKKVLKDNNGVKEFSDLQKLIGSYQDGQEDIYKNDQCKEHNSCEIEGYIVVLSSPDKKICKQHGSFSIKLNGAEKPKFVREIPSSSAKNLFKFEDYLLGDRNYIGLIGDQQEILNIISQNLQLCKYSNANCKFPNEAPSALVEAAPAHDEFGPEFPKEEEKKNFFQGFNIRVKRIDLKKFGFDKKQLKKEKSNFIQQSQDFSLDTMEIEEDNTRTFEKQIIHNAQYNQFQQQQGGNRVLSLREESHAALDIKGKGYFSVVIYEFESGQPLINSSVLFYAAKEESFKCNQAFYNNFAKIQPEFSAITDKTGKVELELLFQKADSKINYVIIALKNGYHNNCRFLTITKDNFLYYQQNPFDIGLGQQLGNSQTRVVLEWNRKPDPAKNEIDLDLYTQFGEYSKGVNQDFNCQVGYFNKKCGGVIYHGDSDASLISRSSEALTLQEIGRYDYLIYLSTYVKDIFKKVSQDNTLNFAKQIQDAKPIIKYYASESAFPVKVIESYKIIADSTLADTLTQTFKLDILQFCIRANQNDNSIAASEFEDKKNAIWFNKIKEVSQYTAAMNNDLPSTEDKISDKKICDLVKVVPLGA